jgi:hypothetical protein
MYEVHVKTTSGALIARVYGTKAGSTLDLSPYKHSGKIVIKEVDSMIKIHGTKIVLPYSQDETVKRFRSLVAVCNLPL